VIVKDVLRRHIVILFLWLPPRQSSACAHSIAIGYEVAKAGDEPLLEIRGTSAILLLS
jgi:hypothetical protein